MRLLDWLGAVRLQFPRLTASNCRLTSPSDASYNCIAWAAQDTARWWWPDPMQQSYWPVDVPREEQLGAFLQVFAALGFVERTDAGLEAGKQKVAIFTGERGVPTHAARQVQDGWWASKLGQDIDVEHELVALEGPLYGSVAVVLARVVA